MPLQVRFPFLAFIHFSSQSPIIFRCFTLPFSVIVSFRVALLGVRSIFLLIFEPFTRSVLFLFYIISLVHFISLEVPRTWGARFVAFPNGAPFG